MKINNTVSPVTVQNTYSWRILAVCLLSPAVAGLVRKLIPGQPVFIDAAPTVVILVVGLQILFDKNRPVLPRWVAGPLIFWAFIQILYASFSIFEDWRVGAAAIMIRVAPMMMAMIAFVVIRSWDDLVRASTWVGSLALLLLPVGIIVALFGNEVLPFWLQPIEKVTFAGRNFRDGLPAVSAIFTTQWILSVSVLAIFFLSLANVVIAESRQERTTRWWLTAIASLLLVYLSTRRGAFIGGVVGLGVFMMRGGKKFRQSALALSLIVGAVLLSDTYGLALGHSWDSRSDTLFAMDFLKRINVVFIPIFWFWTQATPLGNYLGFAGPEANGFGAIAFHRIWGVVEVGGAQLAAEMGIAGAILMPVIVTILIWRLYSRAKKLRCQPVVNTLLLFQIVLFILYYTKELLDLANVSIAQFFFWAVFGICAALIQSEQELTEQPPPLGMVLNLET